jgi:hypothetical protein
MNNEEAAAMREMPREGFTALGFGAPMPLTKQLVALGYIEIEFLSLEGRDYWRASLTARGKNVK